MTTTTIAPAAGRLRCKCGTRTPPTLVKRNMGRSKSYRLVCGCGKSSAPTFYLERLDDRWNEVATK